jgi:hypothetical protein
MYNKVAIDVITNIVLLVKIISMHITFDLISTHFSFDF